MGTEDLIARLKRNGWREVTGKKNGRHAQLRHTAREGLLTLPAAEPTREARAVPDPALSILSRRKQAMPCYYAAFLPEKKGFSVLFPDVPGCQTSAATPEEAFAMAVDALSGHLDTLAAGGEPLPLPAPSGRAEAARRLHAMCADYGIPLPADSELPLQLIPALEQDAALVRVSVSFRKGVLSMIDRKAEAAGMTRSGFLAAAAQSVPDSRA